MKSVNIAFSKNAYKFLHEMIGKNFAKIASFKVLFLFKFGTPNLFYPWQR